MGERKLNLKKNSLTSDRINTRLSDLVLLPTKYIDYMRIPSKQISSVDHRTGELFSLFFIINRLNCNFSTNLKLQQLCKGIMEACCVVYFE